MKNYLENLKQQLKNADLSRRDFLHISALLSVGLGTSACSADSNVIKSISNFIGISKVMTGDTSTAWKDDSYQYDSYMHEPPEDKRVWKTANPDGSPISTPMPGRANYNSYTWMCE